MDKDIQDRLDRARTIATENVKRATDGVKHGAERVSEQARAATEGAGETFAKAKDQAGKVASQANRIVTENPLAAAAAAIAVGAAIAYMLPKGSRKKARAAGPKLLAVATSVGQKARKGVADAAKHPAAQEAEHLIDKIGDFARHAPANAAEAARSGAKSAQSGLESARSFAVEAARKADIEERAGKFLDAASEAAAKVAGKIRDRAGRSDKG